MKSRTRFFYWHRRVFAFVFLLFQQTALSQGTAFTYQGKLTDGGIPANNTYDLQFKLLTHEQMFETAGYWRMRATPRSVDFVVVLLLINAIKE